MTQITLNDEQTRLLASASFPILIVDSHGRKVAELSATTALPEEMSEEDWIAEAIRRRDKARRDGFAGGRPLQEIINELRVMHPE